MKRLRQSFFYSSISLLLFMLSCIGEDTSNCPLPEQSVRIHFFYMDKAIYISQGIDPADIDKLSLFVFDDNGKFVGEWFDDQISSFGPDYYMTLSLTPDRYKFVVWGNIRDCYSITPVDLIKGQTNIDDVILHLQYAGNGEITYTPHSLFYGNLFSAQVRETGNQIIQIPIVQHSNKINIRVKGLEPNSDTYYYTITDTNGNLKFDNTFAPCSELYYTRTTTFDSQAELNSSLTILKLAEGRSPILKIGNETQGNNLIEANLMTLLQNAISAGASIDFDNTNEYDIVVEYKKNSENGNLGLIISINGWVVTEADSEI